MLQIRIKSLVGYILYFTTCNLENKMVPILNLGDKDAFFLHVTLLVHTSFSHIIFLLIYFLTIMRNKTKLSLCLKLYFCLISGNDNHRLDIWKIDVYLFDACLIYLLRVQRVSHISKVNIFINYFLFCVIFVQRKHR